MAITKRFLFLLIAVLIAFGVSAEPFVVVIDAGHGGKDVGALGRKVREKDVNLAVALKLGNLIEEKMQDVKVVYTRKTDKYLTLQDRAQIANKAKGNLYKSIHTNSLAKKNKKRKTIKGASTYTLGLHRSDDNLEVAMRENSVISLEKDYEVTYQGFDPNSTESYIIFEISQSTHMEQSVDFASRVQKEFVSTAGRVDRGVRQAGFLVLARTSMPAVLVELDFICNPTPEQFLGSKAGQNKLAKSLFNAFREYKKASDNKVAAVEGVRKKAGKEVEETSFEENTADETEDFVAEQETEEPEFVYKVQLMASKARLSPKDSRLKGLSPVDSYKENGLYKYTYGSEDTMEAAQEILRKVKKKFEGAFIVVFSNGVRVK